MKSKLISTIVIFTLAIAIIVIQPASGYANTFLEDDTLIITGRTGEYCIYLQNIGDSDAGQKIQIFQGEEYIKNFKDIDKDFNIPANTISDDFPVCMELKLPNNPGTEKYLIEYGVSAAIKSDGAGMVSFAPIQIKTQFYITATTVKSSIGFGLKLFGIVAVVASLAGVNYFRNKKKPMVNNQVWCQN